MILDNNLYLMKTGGRPNDSTAWTSLWAAATNYSSSIDLASTTNRSIAEAGYLVWRVGTAFTITATGTMNVQLVCSAAAALGTDTVLWETGAIAHDAVEALFTANKIIYVIKIPPVIPLRYLGVAWVIGTDHLDTGTADIFITPDAPYPAV